MLDLQILEPTLRAALAEDIGPGDVTTRLLVPEGAVARALVRAKAAGVLAGGEVAREVLRLAAGDGPEPAVISLLADGTRVEPGTVVLEARGDAGVLLRAERTALNFLGRLSGIATLTARFVAAVEGTPARILDTRKTTPGLRAFEKYAVSVGGGTNHRFALYDAVLVKENHLVFGTGLAEALARRPEGMQAIVEAESIEEFRAAAEAGADIVMLDECSPEQVREACALRGATGRPLIEVSGGVDLKSVRSFAVAGADRISIGALTHSAPPLDLSMRIEAEGTAP